jgi:nucleoside diphosphate kinase
MLLILIKPDALTGGHAPAIKRMLIESGLMIEADERATISLDKARRLCEGLDAAEASASFISRFVCVFALPFILYVDAICRFSGMCQAICVSGTQIAQALVDLAGPDDPVTAKQTHPDRSAAHANV